MGGFSIGYGISVSPRLAAFDPDALAYFTTAGITDNTAKTQINDFVVGIKDLGLWSSMASWPLRSSQNAGTGTTAYSLGGLGTYNGTLTNGPTWGANGITFASASNHTIAISTSISTAQLHSLAFAAGSISSTGSFSRFFEIANSGDASRRNPFLVYEAFNTFTQFQLPNSGVAAQEVSLNLTAQLNTFFSMCGSKETSTMRISINGVSQGTSGSKTFNVGSGYDLANIGSGYNGTIAFGMLASSDFSSSQVLSLHNLYKNTLGQGLGLP
jgi:hypothetical protein